MHAELRLLRGRPRHAVWEDREEPERIGRAVAELGLEHVVITSVNRDDLADGGAAHWAATIRAVRAHAPACRVEVLIPDFQGAGALDDGDRGRPDILNHNTETVPRLYKVARHGGRYERTLELFRRRARPAPPASSPSPGSSWASARSATSWWRPCATCARRRVHPHPRPVPAALGAAPAGGALLYHPDEFAELAEIGRELGFAHVESGPLVRSSYHAKAPGRAGPLSGARDLQYLTDPPGVRVRGGRGRGSCCSSRR